MELTRKEELYQYISDASKDAQGFRVRFDYTGKTVEELEELADYWTEQVELSIQDDARREAAAVAKFEATVQNLIECGAGDRPTAIRWIMDGQDEFDRMYGTEFLEYNLGLPFGYLAGTIHPTCENVP